VGVLQRSKSFHKVVHNIALGLTLTQTSGDNSKGSVARPLLHQLLLIQRGASLHGDERRAARLKPRRNPAQRLALPALLLVFPSAEVGLAADGVRRNRCAVLGLYGEDVELEREWVDEICVYTLWEGMDVQWKFYPLVEVCGGLVTGSGVHKMLQHNGTLIVRETPS